MAARYKKEKRLIADEVLVAIENLNPPGRFLAKDSRKGLWYPVGYEKARNKASQALRENALQLKPNIQSENEALHAELKKYKAAFKVLLGLCSATSKQRICWRK